MLNEPASALSITLEKSEVSCYNANDAFIRAEIEGGVEPYSLIWNNGSIQPEITGLGPGEYILTVEDANGCVQTASAIIPELPLFEINPEIKQVSCYGENDGSIALNLAGGEAPVRVFWDHGPEQSSIFNLPPGSYGVRVMDGKGCEIRREFEITEPDLLILTGQATDALDCNNGQSGSIDLVVSGGRPPFRFNWSNGDTLQNLSNLSSGTYSVEVTDQGGCFATQTFQIRRPAPLEVFMARTQEPDCDLQMVEEMVELNIEGGVAPYTIQWSSGEISENGYKMTTTSPGLYSVEITDGQGCTISTSLEVDNHRILLDPSVRSQAYLDYQAHLVNMEVEFLNNSSGNILTYYWDFGDGNYSLEESPSHTYQEEGEYEVSLRAMDMFGCEYEQNLTLEILDHFMVVPNVFTPNRDGMNDFMYPKFLLVKELSFTILNKWGEVIFQSDDLHSKGWDGSFKGEEAISGNYVYHLSYTTEDGRDFKKNGVFLLMR